MILLCAKSRPQRQQLTMEAAAAPAASDEGTPLAPACAAAGGGAPASRLLQEGYRAVVLGSTGAIGRELVAELVASPLCGSVVAVTRRSVQEQDYPTAFASLVAGATTNAKLSVAVVDYEAMANDGAHADVFAGANFVACCLGTTKGDAGSSDAFQRVDLDCEHTAPAPAPHGYTLACLLFLSIASHVSPPCSPDADDAPQTQPLPQSTAPPPTSASTALSPQRARRQPHGSTISR